MACVATSPHTERKPGSIGSHSDQAFTLSLKTLNIPTSIPPPPNIQNECSNRSSTLSSFTEEDTDWSGDEVASSQDLHFPGFSAFTTTGLFSQEEIEDSLIDLVLSPVKQELIDRIMEEFWGIFDQRGGGIQ